VSEDTIPAAVIPGETIAAASVGAPDAPPPTPFSAAGQPTEMSGFPPPSGAPPIPPPSYGEVRIESDPVMSPSQAAYLAPAAEKKSSKLWWILPILAFLGVIVVAGAGGVYLLLRNGLPGSEPANVNSTPVASPTPAKTTTPTSVASPAATPSASTTPSVTPTPAASPTQSSTPRPTVEPTRPPATPAPKTPAKTTPKPPTKKGSDCIFSGDC
jgi:hypothetical protein